LKITSAVVNQRQDDQVDATVSQRNWSQPAGRFESGVKSRVAAFAESSGLTNFEKVLLSLESADCAGCISSISVAGRHCNHPG
jgi:hypothetical protein